MIKRNVYKVDSLEKLVQVIKSIDNVYILTHMYPDGDALGSSFVLCRVLQKLGKKAAVKIADGIPEKFVFMKKYVTDQDFKPMYIVAVDLASSSLIHPSLSEYSENIDLCIDHHMSNRGFAPISYVDSSAAATTEIIYEIIRKLGIDIDTQMAEGIYVGISSDTGCFKYSNTTYKSHQITADIMKLGLSISSLNERLFTVKSKKQLLLEKLLYRNIEYVFDGKVALTYIKLKELEENNIKDEECEGVASLPVKIEGVCVGITIREKPDGNYKISVRTIGNYNGAKLASLFGGGGHFKAAGFNLSGPLEEVRSKIIEALKTEFDF